MRTNAKKPGWLMVVCMSHDQDKVVNKMIIGPKMQLKIIMTRRR
jgi:hypothetical protein